MFAFTRAREPFQVPVKSDHAELCDAAREFPRGVPLDGLPLPRLSLTGRTVLADSSLDESTVPSFRVSAEAKSHAGQTTYTTAGTVYDPSSRLLLQPPNRRGRPSKHGSATAQPDITLPTSATSILDSSVKLESSSFMTTAASLRNYTPLQQNYDRAINPFSDIDHQATSMPLQAPRLHPLRALPSYLYDPEMDERLDSVDSDEDMEKKDKGKAKAKTRNGDNGNNASYDEGHGGDGAEAESSETDNDWGMDPLMNMPVKSLHNLASYPNPNQKKAQQILLFGARPDFMKSSRLGAAPQPFQGHEIPRGSEKSQGYRKSPSIDEYHANPHFHSSARMDEFKEPSASMGATISQGPGAPKPLTAGPPGQRQYRPSNLSSTLKPPSHHLLQNANFDEEAASMARKTLIFAGIDEAQTISVSSSSSLENCFEGQELPSDSQPLASFSDSVKITRNDPLDPCLDRSLRFDDAVSSSVRPLQCNRCYPCTLPCLHSEAANLQSSDFIAPNTAPSPFNPIVSKKHLVRDCSMDAQAVPLPTQVVQQRPLTQSRPLGCGASNGRLSEEQIEERNRRINFFWYQGIRAFGDFSPKYETPAPQIARKKNIFGTIGDSQASKRSRTDKKSIEL